MLFKEQFSATSALVQDVFCSCSLLFSVVTTSSRSLHAYAHVFISVRRRDRTETPLDVPQSVSLQSIE